MPKKTQDKISATQTMFDILRILDKVGIGKSVPGEIISKSLEISNTDIWKYVNMLRDIGYHIDVSPETGYTLKKRTCLLLPYEVKKFLKTQTIGREIYHFDQVPSTNALARKMLHETEKVRTGTIIIAERQTCGIGRMNHAWISPEGGIWATIVVMPNLSIDQTFNIMMAGSLAIARTIRHEFGLSALIKWPNDVFIGDKKVAGITIEIVADKDTLHHCLMGVGIDVNMSIEQTMPSISKLVTSISDELGHEVERAQFFAKLLKEFERRYQMVIMGETEPLFQEWHSISYTLHRRVRIRTMKECFEGEAIGIDEHGALLVHRDGGEIERVIAADCFVL